MTIKFFATGSDFDAAKKYLEQDLDSEGKIRQVKPDVLSGDLELMARLCGSSHLKLTYASGVDSWPVLIPEHVERKRREGLLNCLAPGMSDRIAHAFVRHSEHGRTESHFLIGRINLWTGRSFTPFWHQLDIPLLRAFNTISCIDQGLVDADHPLLARIVPSAPRRVSKAVLELHEDVSEIVGSGVRIGSFVSREQVVQRLQECGYQVRKTWKSGIKVRSPDEGGAEFDFCGGVFAERWKYGLGTHTVQRAAADLWDVEAAKRRQVCMKRFNSLWANKLLYLRQRYKREDASPEWEELWQLPPPRALLLEKFRHPLQIPEEQPWTPISAQTPRPAPTPMPAPTVPPTPSREKESPEGPSPSPSKGARLVLRTLSAPQSSSESIEFGVRK